MTNTRRISLFSVRLVSATCLLAAVANVACDDRRISLTNLQQILAEEYAEKAGAAVETVRCPERVPTRKGHHFECTMVFAAGESQAAPGARELIIDVEQLGGTQLRWQPGKPVAWLPEARAAIDRTLADKGHTGAELTCPAAGPPPIYLLAPATLGCRVQLPDGRSGAVEYTFAGPDQVSIRIDLPD